MAPSKHTDGQTQRSHKGSRLPEAASFCSRQKEGVRWSRWARLAPLRPLWTRPDGVLSSRRGGDQQQPPRRLLRREQQFGQPLGLSGGCLRKSQCLKLVIMAKRRRPAFLLRPTSGGNKVGTLARSFSPVERDAKSDNMKCCSRSS